MNISEFKAWFEGFTENLEGTPNAKQWKRINEKIGKIEDAPPVTQHHFHDNYYNPWRRWYYGGPYWAAGSSAGLSDINTQTAMNSAQQISQAQALMMNLPQNSATYGDAPVRAMASAQMKEDVEKFAEAFDSGAAFRELGRAEARSLEPKR